MENSVNQNKAVDRITDEIIKSAKTYAENVENDAETYYLETVSQAEKEASDYALSQRKEAKKQAEEIISRKSTLAKLEARKNLLSARQKLVEIVYKRAVNKLNEMDKGEYEEFIISLIGSYAEEGDEVLLPENSKLSAEEVERTEIVKSKRLTVRSGGKFNGGIMLVGKKFDKDLSFTALCDSIREKTESEIADELFKD